MLKLAVAAVALAVAAANGSGGGSGGSGFEGAVKPIRGQVKERVVGSSWRPGCPVHIRKLRLVEVTHWGFDGEPHRGRLVVHRAEAREILAVMRRLYRKRFPIRRMELIDRYDANDRRSMRADNSSAFNCRFVAGTRRWSMHAYGRAIDINPVENPYVAGSHVSPPKGRPFADRSRRAKGMIHRGDVVVRAFRKRAGWRWGGAWHGTVRDYQHFSSTGS